MIELDEEDSPFSITFVANMLCPIHMYFPSTRLKLVDRSCIFATV